MSDQANVHQEQLFDSKKKMSFKSPNNLTVEYYHFQFDKEN